MVHGWTERAKTWWSVRGHAGNFQDPSQIPGLDPWRQGSGPQVLILGHGDEMAMGMAHHLDGPKMQQMAASASDLDGPKLQQMAASASDFKASGSTCQQTFIILFGKRQKPYM